MYTRARTCLHSLVLPHPSNDAIYSKFIRLFIYLSLGVYPNSNKDATIVRCKIIHTSLFEICFEGDRDTVILCVCVCVCVLNFMDTCTPLYDVVKLIMTL